MLKYLVIRNLALIREVVIDFGPGFTAITGETGAGKTLIVEALSALGGGRMGADIVRDGARFAIVEAEFEHESDSTIILRREISSVGRSRAFLDDSPIPLKQIADLAASLFDITSQRAFSHLLNPIFHLDLLDQFAQLSEQRERMSEIESQYNGLKRRLDDLYRRQSEFMRNQELLRFHLAEIEAVDPQPGEEVEVQAELGRLEHFEELFQMGQSIQQLLVDDDLAVDSRLAETAKLLAAITRHDPELSDLSEELADIRAVVREIARRIEIRCLQQEFDSAMLDRLRERQLLLSGLVRKYGGSYSAMLEYRDEMRKRQEEGSGSADKLKALRHQQHALAADWSELAGDVSEIRRSKAEALEKLVVHSIARLGVKDASLKIHITKQPDPTGLYRENGKTYRLSRAGIDEVEFYFSGNPGMQPRPLAQVASGGELSRIMLALKEALPAFSGEATVVFDEIDTGVSGRIAQLVGLKLSELARQRQMLAVTHLPQIAGFAAQHLHIYKTERDGKMETRIHEISGEERVREIAGMISGGELSQAALEQARNLIQSYP